MCCTKDPVQPEREPLRLDTLMRIEYVGLDKVNITSALLSVGGSGLAYGHVWSLTNPLPTLADTKIEQTTVPASLPFSFTSTLSFLMLNKTYYVRPYARTTDETAYGPVRTVQLRSTFGQFLVRALEDSLRDRNIGYGVLVFDKGILAASGHGGLRSRTMDPEGEKPFDLNTKLHVASMSKTLTALAFLRLAAEKGIRTTDRILPFLPPNWTKGPNMERVTFGELLTHRSGLIGLGDNCLNGAFAENIYNGLQKLVAKGVRVGDRGNYCYQNANFGLFRVLIPALMGYQFTGNEANDDSRTQQMYANYLQQNIFEKAGQSRIQTSFPAGNPTYTYDFPYSGVAGWNPGNFDNTVGGYGWYMTPMEAGQFFADVFGTKQETVLPNAYKDTLLTNRLGTFRTLSAATGTAAYYHDGLWRIQSPGYRGLRTLWMHFSDGTTVVLFVNALNGANGQFPSLSNTDIVPYVLRGYDRARLAAGVRRAAPNWIIEHPEPH